MNHTKLLTFLSKRTQLSKQEVGERVKETTAIITAELIKNNVISIMNLGTLRVKQKHEHVDVDPETGDKLLVPPELVVGYKTSSSLKKLLMSRSHERNN
jgi:nucleoid DNA-binding protein